MAINEKQEKNKLVKVYSKMSDNELSEMLSIDRNEYEEEIFEILLTEAKKRNYGKDYCSIFQRANDISLEKNKITAEQPLSKKQKLLFTVFPIIAFWGLFFFSEECVQRRKDCYKCMWVGLIMHAVLRMLLIFLIA